MRRHPFLEIGMRQITFVVDRSGPFKLFLICIYLLQRIPFKPHVKNRRSQGGGKRGIIPTFLENIVILCFKRRFSKQNSFIRLKSNIVDPLKFLTPQCLRWLRH